MDYLKCGDLADITEFFDEAKAKEYRDAAIPELTAAGVTFPIKVQMPYNPSSTDWDKQCQVFKQQLESVLNDGFDFIDIIITAGPLRQLPVQRPPQRQVRFPAVQLGR